ncbi:MAG TPA: tetratricopeptide repeat protein [Burkholderiales bacterium]|nr:tetratricopeptide repeat protein [Burkholderiales bacterium]
MPNFQMRLQVFILALLAGFVISAPLHAADSPSPPARAPEDPDLASGRKAIEAQDWRSAIDSFNRLATRQPSNADAQNLLGYSWRKSGNLDQAFKYYNEALRLDPGNKGAHEYIGEAYLMVNNLPKAEEHLARLDKLCFLPCSEYRDLKKAVEKYKSTAK